MKIRRMSKTRDWLLFVLFYILLLQDPISVKIPVMKYTDEVVAMFGPAIWFYRVLKSGRITLKKENNKIILPLILFCIVGLVGNNLYKYQIKSAVLIDLYTNLKFFFTLLFGYEVFLIAKENSCRQVFLEQARTATILLFLLTVLDLVTGVFPSNSTRYGIRVVQLFYFHPTYLAGAVTFLLAVLILFFDKKNQLFAILSCVVLFFTLRGKSLATIAVFFLVYFFLIYQRKKLRVWHIILIGLAALLIAWDQFAYYYIDLEGASARSALTQKAILVAKDHFPIGTGFGTYGSYAAVQYYSQVYRDYGLSAVHGLTEGSVSFGSDTFWPIILGQTGFLGLALYLLLLYAIFQRVLRIRRMDTHAYAAGIFMFGYFAISSTSEPTFCNVVSMPLAFLLGFILAMEKQTDAKQTKG